MTWIRLLLGLPILGIGLCLALVGIGLLYLSLKVAGLGQPRSAAIRKVKTDDQTNADGAIVVRRYDISPDVLAAMSVAAAHGRRHATKH